MESDGDPLLQSTCRACLRKQNIKFMLKMKCTFYVDKKKKFTVKTGLEALGLEISLDLQDDKMPQMICVWCFDSLKKAVKFRTTYMNSQSILRSLNYLQEEKGVTGSEIQSGEPEFEKIDAKEKNPPDPQCDNDDGKDEKSLVEEIEYLTEYEDIVYGQYNKEKEIETTETIPIRNETQPDIIKDRENLDPILSFLIQVIKSSPEPEKKDPEKIVQKAHIEETHTDDVKLKCYICNKTFLSFENLQQHYYGHRRKQTKSAPIAKSKPHSDHMENDHCYQKRNTANLKFSCILCNEAFPTKQNLIEHCESNHKTATFDCQSCDQKFTEIQEYLEHCSKKKFKCRFCDKRYFTRSEIKDHETTHAEEKPFLCNHCGKTFKMYPSLSRHILKEHTNVRPYVCKLCGKAYVMKKFLDVHNTYKHTEERPYECHDCGKTFKTKYAINRHILRHLRNKGVTNIPVSYFSNYSNTRTGQRTQYICSQCNKTFRHLQKLENHLKKHNEKREFQCTQCKCSFKCITNLRTHIYGVHDKRKPHKCRICNKGFSLPSVLKHHMYIHTGERPYQCEFCGKGFRMAQILNNHKRLHTGEKPYQCKICNKNFRHQNTLSFHLEKHEKGTTNL